MTKTFRDFDRENDFYNKANIQHLEEQAKLYKNGKMKLVKKSLDDLDTEK